MSKKEVINIMRKPLHVGRLISFLVFFVSFLLLGATIASSQTLSLDDQTAAEVDESVVFTLSIDYPSSESGEISSVTIDINFDQTVLTYDSHTRGSDSLVEDWNPFNVSNPQEGKLVVAGLTLTPGGGLQPGDSGTIVQLSFTVTAMADATLTISAADDLASFSTRPGQFTFELPPTNNPPMASDDMATTEEDTPVVIDVLANDSDSDGNSLTITAVTQGDHGNTVVNNGATVTYTPDAGFTGSDEFTYTVSDGTDQVTATVMVTVTAAPAPPPVNNPPVAVDDMAMTDEGESVTINVLANDRDADGDSLTITDVTESNHGSVSIADNGASVIYAPDVGFTGRDEFMYTVSDGEAADTATVYVDVEEADVDPGGDSDGDSGGGGGGCTLDPGAQIDPTLLSVLALFMGVYFVRRLARRQLLR